MGCRLHGWKGINTSSLFFVCDEGVSAWDWFFSLLVRHATRIAYLHVFSIIRIFSPLYQGYFCQGEEEEEEDRG